MSDDHSHSLTTAVLAAYADPALREKIHADVERTLAHKPREEAPGRVACALCGDVPWTGWYVNGTVGGLAPGFRGVFADEAAEPTICGECLAQDWHGRARHVALAVDALDAALAAEKPWEAVQAWRERALHETPPQASVDAMALRLAELLEEVALAGLQRIEKTRASGEMDVLVGDWRAEAVAHVLSAFRPSPAVRLRLDESILLVDAVIATGVGYQSYNGSTDFDCIDGVNDVYLGLKRFP